MLLEVHLLRACLLRSPLLIIRLAGLFALVRVEENDLLELELFLSFAPNKSRRKRQNEEIKEPRKRREFI